VTIDRDLRVIQNVTEETIRMDDQPRIKTKDVSPRPGEMIKPGEIIGIPGMEGWSLADRRTWNLLLVNAWGERLEDPTADFEILMRELRGLHDSNDRVRDSLRKLQTTLIEARMPDGKTRTVQMLGGCDIDDDDRTDGRLKYDFHRKLVPLLRRSEVYARMETKVLSSFTSKYGLALYEALALRMNLRRTVEELDLATLRHWLGVETGKLDRYPDLNRKAIRPAVAEVNALSPYSVMVEPIKRGKKVERVRITWAKKEPFSPAEQAAAREVNRAKVGRSARISGRVETVVCELSPEEIQKGYDAAAKVGARIDKHAAYFDWKGMVQGFETVPTNPVGHFIEFCKKRARELV
jgi:Initiator Replication protein